MGERVNAAREVRQGLRTGLPLMGLSLALFCTTHVRAFSGAATRTASASLRSGVTTGPKALPAGLATGSGAAATTSISATELAGPSTAISSRAQNMCWCVCALTPGATITPWLGALPSPSDSRLVESSPERRISYSIVPSCCACPKDKSAPGGKEGSVSV